MGRLPVLYKEVTNTTASHPKSMEQNVCRKSTARLTLQPVITYFVKVDGFVVFFSQDYQTALDYVLAWRESHEGKKRISMSVDSCAEWKRMSSADGAKAATFC